MHDGKIRCQLGKFTGFYHLGDKSIDHKIVCRLSEEEQCFAKIIAKTLKCSPNELFISSPVVCLCDTPGVVRRLSSVVRRLCRL